jgi:3-dehydroquinate dehydratase-1
MAVQKAVKTAKLRFQTVGVISTEMELRLALRMSRPPDLFELRLDHLFAIKERLPKKMPLLRAPIIITARHPAEGGANSLLTRQRRDLLLDFLPGAQYVDVELRSAKHLRMVLDQARSRHVRRIISFHDFGSTPQLGSLRAKARAAKSFGADIFKVATRTDRPAQLKRLLDFVSKKDVDMGVSVMGIGKLGALSRVLLAQLGSALLYTSLGESRLEGQMSLEQLRSLGNG